MTAPNARSSADPRRGALLRVGEGPIHGYADLFAWPELGDLPLAEQLKGLAQGVLTPLTERALELARVDGQARQRGESVFAGRRDFPRNHFLLTQGNLSRDEWLAVAQAGFRRAKIKVGPDVARELPRLLEILDRLPVQMQARLDFNSTLDEPALEALVQGLGSLRARIEFWEDPLPWDAERWHAARSRLGIRLALDRHALPALRYFEPAEIRESVDVLVVKPAYAGFRAETLARLGLPVVVTSNMDHPLGQVAALYQAMVWESGIGLLDCGLLSHSVYEVTDFAESLVVSGPQLLAPAGAGFGFDPILNSLTWEALG